MKPHTPIVDASFQAVINAPIDSVDLPAWLFSQSEADYMRCSPAHIAVGQTTGANGQRVVVNVELIGHSAVVQRYQEKLSEPHHLVLTSFSDVFGATGRQRVHVRWELSVNAVGAGQCELTSQVVVHATDAMIHNLAQQGIDFEQFRQQRQQAYVAHHQAKTPQLAASLERAALHAALS
ncbi:hypothetical protein LJ737_14385 [Hymenobacter sp. 15J16-1T3B]|uniref:hypothetical protein n=1 Tax=Hymenobacter sp. 15J16-1T3B TaxID=2886941 RepID=UPI001D1267E5|nr:hypothetical protein [Hymenobacter sp. 15J16-1T3B]MCC3158434.1 hypothetical protein [Hymenobacter sp. 15J16-1T3B]